MHFSLDGLFGDVVLGSSNSVPSPSMMSVGEGRIELLPQSNQVKQAVEMVATDDE
jgi:hypothetical protein